MTNDDALDPVTTHALFEHDRVAAGYATARPFLHPEAFARVGDLVRGATPFSRALDVGCGTGLSSVALLDLADEVVGIDVSVPMLLRAPTREHVRYLASSAEALPFRPRSFGLVVACGAIDWVDRTRFLPRAADLLTAGGWLVPLDFGDAGRSPEVPALERWHRDVLQKRFPTPSSPDPLVSGDEAAQHGFAEPEQHPFATECGFTAGQYADFLMTESNVIAAVEYGETEAEEIRRWLGEELSAMFGKSSRPVAFGGYIQVLQRQ